MTVPLIIHHKDCPDGYAAAWWLGKHLGAHEKYAASYNQPPPYELIRLDGEKRDVWIVDFCYPPADLGQISAGSRTVTIFDHHATAAQWLDEYHLTAKSMLFPNMASFCDVGQLGGLDRFAAVMDQTHSGAGLVAQYVKRQSGIDPPGWFRNLQDRDLWKFEYGDETRHVFAAVTSRPYTDAAWDEMAGTSRSALAFEGAAIERYRQQLIEQIVDTAYLLEVAGHEVWIAGSPYAVGSDVAGELAKRKPELFGAYFVDYGDRLKIGLRSTPDGMDVAKLAEQWPGGGGHTHASGFEVRRGRVT